MELEKKKRETTYENLIRIQKPTSTPLVTECIGKSEYIS